MATITGRLDDDRRDDEGTTSSQSMLRSQAVYSGTPGNDHWTGTDGADTAHGGAGNDELHGGANADTIYGNAGNDVIYGDGGQDSLYGNLGDDLIRGGDGRDLIDGGPGNDELHGNAGYDDLRGGAGDDTLYGLDGNDFLRGDDGNDQLWDGKGTDTLWGGAGDDFLHGGDSADELVGGDGNDELWGGEGHDLIEGSAGNDLLLGNRGLDTLKGGDGDDILDGGPTADVLEGGAGADTFRFTSLDGQLDRISDYQQGIDRLDLAPLMPNLTEGYRLQDYVRFTETAEGTVISVDKSGDGDSFVDLVLLAGVQVDSLPTSELGLPDALPTSTVLASSSEDGTAGNGLSFFGSLSADGRFVTFSSASTNFVGGDDAGFDVFQKDLLTGEIVRISEAAAPGNGDSFRSAMSADGKVVAFDTEADNLDPTQDDGNGRPDVYVTDLGTGEVTLESIRLEGPGHWNQFADTPSISADGTLVAFTAAATADPAGTPTLPILPRIFVRDLTDGSLTEVSKSADGTQFANGASHRADISADGKFVVFDSAATNLLTTPDANPMFHDVYIKSLVDGSIRLVSADADGNQGFDTMRNATVSGDGRFVAFETEYSMLDGDTNEAWDVYVKDMVTGELSLVSTSQGDALGNGDSHGASISDDGRYIAFRSAASNLVDGDDDGGFDIFVKDLQTGALQRFDVLDDGGGNFDLLEPLLAGDGHYVAYTDQVTSAVDGSLTGGQVMVASVDLDSLVAAAPPVA